MESADTTPLVSGEFRLEKFPGKGGWTYIALPLENNRKAWFGWRTVRGSIDSYELSNYKLMPMGHSRLFLPVKAEIRKKIKKEVGDTAAVVLYSAEPPAVTSDDFGLCLRDEPMALTAFDRMTKKEQVACRDWIFSVAHDGLRVERMAAVINRLAEGKSWID